MTVAAVVYLAVSAENAVFQGLALWRSCRRHAPGGTVRTITCRVLIALVYVGIGVITLIDRQSESLPVALVVFAAVQLVWQGNSWLDLHDSSRKSTTPGRRPR